MKSIMIAMLSLMLTLPMMAQYGRPRYSSGRYGYSTYTRTSYRHNPVNSYFGFRVGGAFSTVSSDDKYLDGSDVRAGLNVGMAAGFSVMPRGPLYLETGLYYTEKGGKGNVAGDKFTYNLNYLEMPLVMKYYIDIDRYCSIQPFLGGYVACGIGGKIKDFGERAAYNSFSDSPYSFRRMDAGLRTGCGLQIDMFYAELSYDLGLANICKDDFDTSKNGALMLSLGVNF
jgi:hypothetical protein